MTQSWPPFLRPGPSAQPIRDGYLLWSALCAILFSIPAVAQHADHGHHTAAPAAVRKPRVFLDKSSRIVEYQLRRLSNAQLLLVDRQPTDAKYLPVYHAILTRPGMSLEPRVEAIRGIAEIKGTSAVDELLAALESLELSGRNDRLVFEQLTRMLLDQPEPELREHLEQVRTGLREESATARIASFAAILHLGLADEAWKVAQEGELQKLAYLAGLRQLPSGKARLAFVENIYAGLGSEQSIAVRRAAIQTLATIPAASADSFLAIAPLINESGLRPSVVQTLLRLPSENWPREPVQRLLSDLVSHVESIAPEARTTLNELDGLQLADNLLALVPPEQAREFRARLRDVTVQVVQIATVHEEMRYDKPFFAVEAGKSVQIVLRNDDAMPHNLVVAAPGSLREVAVLASQMGPEAGADGKQYVPESDLVLHATGMVQPNQQERLIFEAPAEAGDYPFVCTFPRHWMRMYGVMVVVDNLDTWLENPQPPADPLGNTRPIVKNWIPEDFADIERGLRGRSAEIGQRLFEEATCAQCHKMKGAGGAVGPELTEVLQKWKGDYSAVLREILDPSYRVEPKYAMHTLITADGQVLSGVVTEQNAKSLTVVTNPEAPQPQVVARDEIEEIIQSNTSMMPKGLLDRYSRDEIFELLAFICGQSAS